MHIKLIIWPIFLKSWISLWNINCHGNIHDSRAMCQKTLFWALVVRKMRQPPGDKVPPDSPLGLCAGPDAFIIFRQICPALHPGLCWCFCMLLFYWRSGVCNEFSKYSYMRSWHLCIRNDQGHYQSAFLSASLSADLPFIQIVSLSIKFFLGF